MTRWGLLHAHELAGANWSPDGTSIVSATRKGGLVEVDVATGGATPVAVDLRSNDFAVMPDYSPDGEHVVFAMFRDAPDRPVRREPRRHRPASHHPHQPDRSELAPDWS